MNVIISEVQALLSDQQFFDFLKHYAGTNVTFAMTRKGASFAELAGVVGERTAAELCDQFAPACVYVARNAHDELQRRNDEIRRRFAAGESSASIARSYQRVTTLSVRTVRRIAAAMTKETDNGGNLVHKAACGDS